MPLLTKTIKSNEFVMFCSFVWNASLPDGECHSWNTALFSLQHSNSEYWSGPLGMGAIWQASGVMGGMAPNMKEGWRRAWTYRGVILVRAGLKGLS